MYCVLCVVSVLSFSIVYHESEWTYVEHLGGISTFLCMIYCCTSQLFVGVYDILCACL